MIRGEAITSRLNSQHSLLIETISIHCSLINLGELYKDNWKPTSDKFGSFKFNIPWSIHLIKYVLPQISWAYLWLTLILLALRLLQLASFYNAALSLFTCFLRKLYCALSTKVNGKLSLLPPVVDVCSELKCLLHISIGWLWMFPGNLCVLG